MERFICHECGARFDYPEKVMASRGEFWGVPCEEAMYYCPECGSEEFDEYKEEKEKSVKGIDVEDYE